MDMQNNIFFQKSLVAYSFNQNMSIVQFKTPKIFFSFFFFFSFLFFFSFIIIIFFFFGGGVSLNNNMQVFLFVCFLFHG